MIILRKNKKVSYALLFIVIFIVTFCYTCFFFHVSGDEVWNFGFAYNIANGFVPYRDFNMIITPLYSFLGSIFIKIFGSYLYSLHILDAILIAIIVVMLFKIISWKSFLVFPFIIVWGIPSYNMLCLFFIFLILYLVYEKKSEYLISFIISLLFLTKQTVGICMFIPFFFKSKNKIKVLIVFFMPILVFLIYLVWNGALYNFIDYCFLGMFDFGSKNTLLSKYFLIEIGAIIYLIYQLIRKKENREELFYILAFQIMAFPIIDFYHFIVAIVPFVYYILKEIKSFNIGLVVASFIILIVCCYVSLLIDKDKTYYLYDNFLDYRVDVIWGDSSNDSLSIDEQIEVVNKYYSDSNNFLFMRNAYLVKIFIDEPINEFDIINNGNMGYNGAKGYIEEIDDICSNEDCIFIIDNSLYNSKVEVTQMNQEILDYVYLNYNLIDSYKTLDVLSN